MVMPYRIAYGSDIAPCIRIDKPLMVYVIDGHNNISYTVQPLSEKTESGIYYRANSILGTI